MAAAYSREVFYYPGRKGRLASSYPAPEYDVVIEPFGGSMAYSLHHRPKVAIGIEANERVVALWKRLCSMSYRDIKQMPAPRIGERTTDLYWMLCANSAGTLACSYNTVTPLAFNTRFEQQRRMTLRHHPYANHVLYRCGDYTEAPDIEATWFIDPPYAGLATDPYKQPPLDYSMLGAWCRSRRGQVIVCEQDGTWLPFDSHKTYQGLRARAGEDRWGTETIWTNEGRAASGDPIMSTVSAFSEALSWEMIEDIDDVEGIPDVSTTLMDVVNRLQDRWDVAFPPHRPARCNTSV